MKTINSFSSVLFIYYVGKTYCEPYSETLLTVLGEYLEHEDQEVAFTVNFVCDFKYCFYTQICSYVNGALYSLLASPSIRDVARQIVSLHV